MEARVGIEPTHKAFAEPCLTTWLPRRPAALGKLEQFVRGASLYLSGRVGHCCEQPGSGAFHRRTFRALVHAKMYDNAHHPRAETRIPPKRGNPSAYSAPRVGSRTPLVENAPNQLRRAFGTFATNSCGNSISGNGASTTCKSTAMSI